MKTKILAIATMTLTLSYASLGLAAEKIPYGFLNSNPSEIAALAANEMIYSYDMKSSLDWNSQALKEAELFTGFKSFESWNVLNNTNETMIYASEVAFVINKPIDQTSLNRLSTAEFISSIDPGFTHQAVSSEEANTAYTQTQEEGKASALRVLDGMLKRGQVTAIQADEASARIKNTASTNMNQNWCASASAQCVKSTAIIPFLYKSLLATASTIGINVPDSVEVYSELKPISSLNGASAGISLTGFLANKTLISLKNDILAWDIGSGSSLVTIKTYVVIEKDDLDKFKSLGSYDFVLGNTYFNRDEGIAMGLPLYNQRMAEALKNSL